MLRLPGLDRVMSFYMVPTTTPAGRNGDWTGNIMLTQAPNISPTSEEIEEVARKAPGP